MARSLRVNVDGIISGAQYRGINLTGLENEKNVVPPILNTNITQNSNSYYEYIARKGFNMVRLCIAWEHIQPDLNGQLDATYKSYVDNNIAWALANNIVIVLDIHNYGRRYVSGTNRTIGHADGILTQAHFVDLWIKLSTAYKNNTTIIAYGLMNEPHDMPVPSSPTTYKTTATWTLSAQAAIDAIRANGDTHIIAVNTDWWSSLPNYLAAYGYGSNPDMWLTDSLNKLWLQIHTYFDSTYEGSYSGKNTSWFGSGLDMRWGGDKLEAVCQWAESKGVTLFIGEYAVPEHNLDYLLAFNDFINILDKYKINGCWFAMGHWFGTGKISLNPRLNFTLDRQQMRILKKHL